MPILACRATVAAVAALVVAGLVGCGRGPAGAGQGSAAGGGDQEWVDNASGVLDQLTGDVAGAQPPVPGVAGARQALRDLSELYGLLVVYTDLGGCSKMVAQVGKAPPGFAGVLLQLDRACIGFERGAALFSRAASRHDARALVAAWRRVDASRALLYRATLAFAAARSAAGR